MLQPRKPSRAAEFEYLAWHHLLSAIYKILAENHRSGTFLKQPVDSILWVVESDNRRSLWERARRHWYDRTKTDPCWFPYNQDTIARLYFYYRKLSQETVEARIAELDGLLPDNPTPRKT